MKKIILLIYISIFTGTLFAQVDTIPDPPGLTPLQLGKKSILRVSPDDHIWISYRNVGAGEYDGSNWHFFTDTNGMPSRNVRAFAFDGAIRWIGTDNGLVKTLGINFLTFHTGNSPIPSNNIKCLYMGDTSLWIGTDKGVVSVSNNYWVPFSQSNSPILSDTVVSISGNSFGIYFATKYGVSILKSNGWTNASPDVGMVYRFTKDMLGNLYWKNYQIHDSIFKKIIIPSNLCLYNLANVQPQYFLGSTSINELYAVTPFVYSFDRYILSFDTSLSPNASYFINDQYPGFAGSLETDSFQLFDFNGNGELISSSENPLDAPILKSNITGISMPTSPAVCPYLDINQVQARILNVGSNFWDLSGSALYEVPKGTGRTPIFEEGLWLGGKDPQGNLHVAAQTYRQSGADFWPGPLDTTNASINLQTSQLYDKIWKIDRYTVNVFITKFLDGSVTNGSYIIPDIILNWPVGGSGNISRSLAPFIDYNADGIYNPYDGDYPDMKGDQMIWWVFNDNLQAHTETDSPSNLGVEVHASAYAYNCPLLSDGDSVINYTTFYHYDFINRSDTTYHDVYTAIYTDVDLGNYLDDYVGCDSVMDLAFVYNGDNDDEGDLEYGLNPPMLNLAYLNGPESVSNDGLDNNHNGVVDETGENCMMNYFIYYNNSNSVNGNPDAYDDYYGYSHGDWLDSTPVTYGGTGYNPGSTDSTHYMFSGDPYDSTHWSESFPCDSCSANSPSDKRFLVSSGPFELPAHGKRSIDYAYVFTREPNAPNGPTTSFAVNKDQVQRIKNFFETDSFPCRHLIGVEEIFNKSSISLYPNPAHSSIRISFNSDGSPVKYYITDVVGQVITSPRKAFSNTFEINVNSLTPGIYFLTVESKTGKGVKRFVVQ